MTSYIDSSWVLETDFTKLVLDFETWKFFKLDLGHLLKLIEGWLSLMTMSWRLWPPIVDLSLRLGSSWSCWVILVGHTWVDQNLEGHTLGRDHLVQGLVVVHQSILVEQPNLLLGHLLLEVLLDILDDLLDHVRDVPSLMNLDAVLLLLVISQSIRLEDGSDVHYLRFESVPVVFLLIQVVTLGHLFLDIA